MTAKLYMFSTLQILKMIHQMHQMAVSVYFFSRTCLSTYFIKRKSRISILRKVTRDAHKHCMRFQWTTIYISPDLIWTRSISASDCGVVVGSKLSKFNLLRVCAYAMLWISLQVVYSDIYGWNFFSSLGIMLSRDRFPQTKRNPTVLALGDTTADPRVGLRGAYFPFLLPSSSHFLLLPPFHP